jgi:putative membrane protein
MKIVRTASNDNRKELLLIAILVIFYTVGIVGILQPAYSAYFLSLSPFNLLLSCVVLFIAQEHQRLKFFIFFFFVCLIGFIVEQIGTKTGYLFGEYSYGKNLGIQWSAVPLIIGVNWGLLLVSSASLANRLPVSTTMKIILSAGMMTALDVLMEPVAIKSDFWHWHTPSIPLYNYVCWLGVSLVLTGFYFKFKLAVSNRVFDALFILMTLFFLLLNFF